LLKPFLVVEIHALDNSWRLAPYPEVLQSVIRFNGWAIVHRARGVGGFFGGSDL
jgi:hypothetical protein